MAHGPVCLLTDPERRARMAAAAKDALRGYTIDATAARFAALYDRLVP